jgi:hypothetical protein
MISFMLKPSLLALTLFSSSVFANSWRQCASDRIFIAPEYQNYHWSDHDSAVTTNQPRWGSAVGYEHIAPKEIYFR